METSLPDIAARGFGHSPFHLPHHHGNIRAGLVLCGCIQNQDHMDMVRHDYIMIQPDQRVMLRDGTDAIISGDAHFVQLWRIAIGGNPEQVFLIFGTDRDEIIPRCPVIELCQPVLLPFRKNHGLSILFKIKYNPCRGGDHPPAT